MVSVGGSSRKPSLLSSASHQRPASLTFMSSAPGYIGVLPLEARRHGDMTTPPPEYRPCRKPRFSSAHFFISRIMNVIFFSCLNLVRPSNGRALDAANPAISRLIPLTKRNGPPLSGKSRVRRGSYAKVRDTASWGRPPEGVSGWLSGAGVKGESMQACVQIRACVILGREGLNDCVTRGCNASP